jgi:hypothetical protein
MLDQPGFRYTHLFLFHQNRPLADGLQVFFGCTSIWSGSNFQVMALIKGDGDA